jgi:hypothetical protein
MLRDQNGDEVTLPDLRSGTVVVYFYPGLTHGVHAVTRLAASPRGI